MEKILVTGAGGFAGRHIAEYLYRNGYDVTGTVYRNIPPVDFSVIPCDLSQAIHMEKDFDVIVHAAGSLPYKEQDFRLFKRNNVDSMENLLSFARRKKIKRIVYLSTIGVYGEFRDEIITEESDRINADAYGLTKYMAECLLRAEPGIENISLRMPGIIGPGVGGVWFTNTVEKFRRNEDVVIYSPEFQTRNFVWIGDLCKFICHLLEIDLWKENILLLGSKEKITILELVEHMKSAIGSTSNIAVKKNIRKPFVLDTSRAFRMGYDPLAPLEILTAYLSWGSV